MRKFYDIERHITDDENIGTDKLQYCKENVISLLEAFENWIAMTYTQVLPGSKIGKALAYCLNRWNKLNL